MLVDAGPEVLPPDDPDPWRTDLDGFVMPEMLRLISRGNGPRKQRHWLYGDELMARQYDGPDWVIRGLVSKRSITIIGADPKASKTWCLIDMALAVASGGKAFGEFPSLMEPGSSVALFLNEDSERSVKNRLRALSSGYGYLPNQGRHVRVIARTPLDLSSPNDVAAFIADVRQINPRPAFVGLDPLRNLHGVDENSSSDMRPVLQALGVIRELCDCAVVVVHHAAKATQADKRTAGARLRGSSAIDGFRDGLISLEETEKTDDGQAISNRVVVDLKSFRGGGRFGLELKIEDDEHDEAIKATWAKVDGDVMQRVTSEDRAARKEAAKAAEEAKKKTQLEAFMLRRARQMDARGLTPYSLYKEAAAVLHCRPALAKEVLDGLFSSRRISHTETGGMDVPE